MPQPTDPPIGELIRTAQAGGREAADMLFAALYRELHGLAERELRRGGRELTLGTTTLLHEAYLNIAQREGVGFASRAQFLTYAARAMRGLTIDYVRRRRAKKRGGEFHITASEADVAPAEDAGSVEALEALGAGLDALAAVDPPLAQLVDLHFFGGFSFAELAELRGISERTVMRDWRKARLLLHRVLQDS
ncbi:MAG TPA: ECF-type sigma factor [Gemmatimonadales bacterium]|nr:ECF-type sigma factor [Gemmatimonadales bacterium]